MSELLRFFKDMRDNGYGLAEIAAQLGTSAIAEPVAGFAAMYDPANGAQAIREGMTYQPRTDAGQMYQQGAARTLGAIAQPAMPVIDTWQRGVDIAGGYSPVAGAMLRTVPAAIGALMGYKPAMQTGRQVSNSLGSMQARMIANANAPRTLNTGYMGQRGAVGTQRPLTEFEQAHLLAQQRAALPVNQRGLDLPANNTAMDRARAMGWDTDVYHGSLSDIEAFDPMLSKDLKGTHVGTISEQANHFAKNNGGNVMPLVVKKTKEIELDDIFLNKDKDYYVPQRQSLGIGEKNKKGELNDGYIDELNYYAKKANESRYSDSYDGREITKQEKKFFSELGKFLKSNDVDTVKYFNEVEGASDSYVITNPKNIRSRFAAFDPFNRDSSNLLATTAPLVPTTALGAYMYNEKRKKSQGNQ